jgi:uncharacterized protein (TIRG00374 family)
LFFSDVEKTIQTLVSIDMRYLLGGIGLWLLGGFLRVLRWHFFLKRITTEIPFIRSSLYFLSGFAFLLSPARVGEMLRSPFIKRDYNIPISKTAPIVLVERFYDLLAVTVIISIGLFFTKIDKTVILIPLGIIALIIILIKNKNTISKIFKKLSKIKILNKIIPNTDEAFEITYMLMKPKYFTAGICASLGSALLEVIAAYLFVIGLSGNIEFQDLIVLYHAVNFAAAASMIPAGIGIFEGGLVGLFVLYKMEYEVAFAVTVLIRIVSTGLFTVIGLIALHLVSKD